MFASLHAPGNLPILLDCARQFSPLIEMTSEETVTFDIRGLGSLYGTAEKVAQAIDRFIGIPANIAVAANPDTAVYAARGCNGITVIPPGREAEVLAPLSLVLLHCPAGMGELFDLWGIRTFGQFAELPPLGVAARLGEEGIYWRQLTLGVVQRQLRVMGEESSFARELDLEDPIPTLEPLFFLLSRFLVELCAELSSHSLATNELILRLGLEDGSEHSVDIKLPVPMLEQKTIFKLLQLDLDEKPPKAAVVKLHLQLQPAKARVSQEHLFAPAYPAPEKIELTIARIRHIVGAGNIGTPRVLDSYQPDGFVMEAFAPSSKEPVAVGDGKVRAAFRRFRPPQQARVITDQQPVHIDSTVAKGDVRIAKGPWFTSGYWWRTDNWNREEWDIGLRNGALYRIFRDLTTESWFVEGNYD